MRLMLELDPSLPTPRHQNHFRDKVFVKLLSHFAGKLFKSAANQTPAERRGPSWHFSRSVGVTFLATSHILLILCLSNIVTVWCVRVKCLPDKQLPGFAARTPETHLCESGFSHVPGEQITKSGCKAQNDIRLSRSSISESNQSRPPALSHTQKPQSFIQNAFFSAFKFYPINHFFSNQVISDHETYRRSAVWIFLQSTCHVKVVHLAIGATWRLQALRSNNGRFAIFSLNQDQITAK